MAILENFVIPLIKWFFIIAFVIWILFLFIYGLMKIFNKKRRLWIMYHLLKKSYDEKDVAWCMQAVERNMKEVDVRKHLLLKGTNENRVDEVAFIFNEVQKQVQGGGNHGRFEESNAKAELPKV